MSINLSTKARFAALAVATLLVIAGWYGFAYRPGSAKLTKVKADIVASQAQVAQLQTELARLQALKVKAPKLRADQAKFNIALPSQPAVSAFIRQVQGAANKAGLDFLSIAPSVPSAPAAAGAAPAAAPVSTPAPSGSPSAAAAPAAPATIPGLQTIAISITAKGKFFPMKDFIHRLERLPRALKVNSFSVSGAGGTGGSPDLSVSLSLAIFEGTTIAAPTPPPVSTPPPLSSGA